MVNAYHFTSQLPESYRNALGQLLFFNPLQSQIQADILASIEHFGIPRILTVNGTLRITLDTSCEVQSLFALTDQSELAGCVIYVRDTPTNLTIMHLAVGPKHLMISTAEVPLAVTIFLKVAEIAHHIKGIDTVTVLYGPGKSIPYTV